LPISLLDLLDFNRDPEGDVILGDVRVDDGYDQRHILLNRSI
jgi:hypothetical protein